MNLLSEAFYQLPFQFDPQPILQELQQLSQEEWQDNPQGFPGIESLILVSSNGEDTHSTYGEMRACPRLQQLPNTRSILSIFDAPLGATRVMRLAPGAKVERHVDLSYYWKHRFRIHLVLQTAPEAILGCREQTHHLPAGQIWISDSWSPHFVQNNSTVDRFHIVIDTLGSQKLWDWLTESWNSSQDRPPRTTLPTLQVEKQPLRFEKYGDTLTKHPAQVSEIVSDILKDSTESERIYPLLHRLDRGWKEIYAEVGKQSTIPYKKLLETTLDALRAQELAPLRSNQIEITTLLEAQLGIPSNIPLRVQRPIFILGAPRSGQVALQQLLSGYPSLWFIPRSYDLFEHIPELHPAQSDYQEILLDPTALTARTKTQITTSLKHYIKNTQYSSLNDRPNPLRAISFIDSSPKNSFRLSAIRKLFPDARFIYVHQNPIRNIHNLMDGWRSGKFRPYSSLPAWHHKYRWSFPLIPGWKRLETKSMPEICFTQYRSHHQHIIDTLKNEPKENFITLDAEALEKGSEHSFERLFQFLNLPSPQNIAELSLPLPKMQNQIHNAIEMQSLANTIMNFHNQNIIPFLQK